jgi:branched-chain amino acid transport system ATP-binding protein
MPDAALVLEGLEVRYGSVPAVRGLSLEVGPGEIVGLIGPNGAGKSTTLHAATGLVPVHAGEVRLGERSLVGLSPEQIARAGVALVPEGRRIFGGFSVEENLRLGLAARRDRDGAGALREVYELFPVLAEFRRRSAGALSGGQQQQLAIGRALVADPAVLLLDEPSLGLAPRLVDRTPATPRR